MQLRSLALLVAISVPAPVLAFDAVVSSKVQVYADTDATIVVSPHVTASGTVEKTKTTVSGAYTEDVVSSASVDVRTTASPRIYDRRQEVDVGLSQDIAGTTLAGGYLHARERDYLSNGGSLTLSRELVQKNLTLALRGGYVANVVGRADDPLYQAPMTDLSGDVVVTQLLSSTWLAQLNTTVGQASGMLASPYRKVRIWTGESFYFVPETEPPSRFKVAAAVAMKKYLGFVVLHVDYRFYWDTWSVISHTADARVVLDLDPVTIRFRYRFYAQSAAYFYEQRYETLKAYVSSDRELSRFTSHLFGVKLEWTPARTALGAAFRLDAKVEGMYFEYPEFQRLPQRWALITQAGLEVDL